MAGTLTVFGAGGATGQQVVRQGAGAGRAVRAVGPDWQPEAEAALPPGVEALKGDVLKDDLAPHVRGAGAVISTLGVGFSPSSLVNPPPLYTEGTRNIVRAMRAEGVRRLVVVSATFVATRDRGRCTSACRPRSRSTSS